MAATPASTRRRYEARNSFLSPFGARSDPMTKMIPLPTPLASDITRATARKVVASVANVSSEKVKESPSKVGRADHRRPKRSMICPEVYDSARSSAPAIPMYSAVAAGDNPICKAQSGSPTIRAVLRPPIIADTTPNVANFLDSLFATIQVAPGLVPGVFGIRSGFTKTRTRAARAQKITAFQYTALTSKRVIRSAPIIGPKKCPARNTPPRIESDRARCE